MISYLQVVVVNNGRHLSLSKLSLSWLSLSRHELDNWLV